MTQSDQLELIQNGGTITPWNTWRLKEPNARILLSGCNLQGAQLASADLRGADLRSADLKRADLTFALLNGANLENANLGLAWLCQTSLEGANLSGARLIGAKAKNANLRNANLTGADCSEADFREADMTSADLQKADFFFSDLNGVRLQDARLDGSVFWGTRIANCDLSRVKGLEHTVHNAPSSIDIDTIYRSSGQIPDVFLIGVGVPRDVIDLLISSIRAKGQTQQFQSCFISYASPDKDFATILYRRMSLDNLRVWFAPSDIRGGERIHEQIEGAIQQYDRLLVILSEASIQSDWVMTEIFRAREIERNRRRPKLFPIRICGMEKLQRWQRMDSDFGVDIARELREYHLLDFSNWSDHSKFESEYLQLRKALRIESSATDFWKI